MRTKEFSLYEIMFVQCNFQIETANQTKIVLLLIAGNYMYTFLSNACIQIYTTLTFVDYGHYGQLLLQSQ